jgi:hypothetical protein
MFYQVIEKWRLILFHREYSVSMRDSVAVKSETQHFFNGVMTLGTRKNFLSVLPIEK